MAFYDDQSLGYMQADGGAFGDFDWYDGGDFISPGDGGYPGGIPGYDDYTVGELAPVNPADVIPTTTEAPYDPYADEGPSQTNPDVVGTDNTVPNAGEIVITDDRPVAPDDIPDMGEIIIEGTTPRETQPDVVIDKIIAPDLELPDLTPFLPEEEVPEIEIVDTRPPNDRIIPDLRPPFELTPEDLITPVIESPDILEPVPPIEDDIPELVIEDKKEPVEPVVPDDIIPPDIIEEPPEDIVEPESPIVEPPIIDLPPIVTPPPPPPIVEPPPYVPRTPNGGQYLNPGMIETTPFYKTTNDVQSKYYWGDRQLQLGDTFNPQTWNDVPMAPKTPFGIQELGQPMTLQAAMNVLQGIQNPAVQQLSLADQAYVNMLDPSAAQAFLRRKGLA